MEFDGVAGSCGCGFDGRGDALLPVLGVCGRAGELVASAACLAVGSALRFGHGGGNGETETHVMDAEWALYVLRD
jgi:hypothetical protein